MVPHNGHLQEGVQCFRQQAVALVRLGRTDLCAAVEARLRTFL